MGKFNDLSLPQSEGDFDDISFASPEPSDLDLALMQLQAAQSDLSAMIDLLDKKEVRMRYYGELFEIEEVVALRRALIEARKVTL